MVPLIDPRLAAYTEAHTTPRPPLFEELRRVTRERTTAAQMQVGAVEGTLLKTLCAALAARRVVEVGTFTGYSALCMAEALPEDGQLITCDRDPEATAIARAFFGRSPHGRKIEIRLGDALETLRALPREEPIDLAFLDADKARYADYADELVPRLRPGGLLLADNTLWSGKVLDEAGDEDTRGIQRFNAQMVEDPRVEVALLSVRDGVSLARKL